MKVPLFGEIIFRCGIQLYPHKLDEYTGMPSYPNRKELQSFLGIMNYLGKSSLATSEACKPLQILTLGKADWTGNIGTKSFKNKDKLSSRMMNK